MANLQHGKEFHCYLTRREGFEEHLLLWNLLVDMYARSGKIVVARKLFNLMSKKDAVTYTSLIAGYGIQAEMWATLLRAGKIHRNTEIGEWAAEKLLELRPDNPGYYLLIANMYADARRWNKLAKVRTVMRDFRVRKSPGCAWVDTGSGFSPFLVSDTFSGQTNDIYCLLGGLNRQMKDTGHLTTEDSSSEEELCEGLL
ncbi:hypothetical protein RND71_014335 [Anisodus tanguticus]|uniref:Pentatricopeptide repeat-containing protein n=1 Tax=Anisodus tanguticus TaxID=243964 RepID=A0AAE1SB13_9SOLA|nr:hypothetical protein RND71_014335 [Anisodus tanguticus]